MKLDPNKLADALDALSDEDTAVNPDDEFSSADIHGLAGQELARRLRNPASRKQIPPTALAQVLTATGRAMEREKAQEKPEDEQAPDLLDSIAGLPVPRQIQVLEAEMARLKERQAAITARLDTLKE